MMKLKFNSKNGDLNLFVKVTDKQNNFQLRTLKRMPGVYGLWVRWGSYKPLEL